MTLTANRPECSNLSTVERRGFTLIELLIVVALILVLAGMTVMFLPNLDQQARAAQGGAQLQNWFTTAKQRALRDGAPRGLRLFRVPPPVPGAVDNNAYSIEMQFIDQPDDLTGNQGVVGNPNGVFLQANGPLNSVLLNGVDLSQGAVLPGDYLEVYGTGLVHQISQVSGNTLTLASPLPYALSTINVGGVSVLGTCNFRIIRQPRPSGEEKLMLPTNIGVDLGLLNNNVYTKFGTVVPPNKFQGLATLTANNDGSVDVLFAPSGSVIGGQLADQVIIGLMSGGQPQSQTFTDRLVFWVRDYSIPSTQGEPTLVIVFSASGLAAAAPVDQTQFPQVASPPVSPFDSPQPFNNPFDLTLNP